MMYSSNGDVFESEAHHEMGVADDMQLAENKPVTKRTELTVRPKSPIEQLISSHGESEDYLPNSPYSENVEDKRFTPFEELSETAKMDSWAKSVMDRMKTHMEGDDSAEKDIGVPDIPMAAARDKLKSDLDLLNKLRKARPSPQEIDRYNKTKKPQSNLDRAGNRYG